MFIKTILLSVNSWISKQSKPPSSTIGDTRIINGSEYWNMGDLDDQDNWRYVGPAEPRYFIHVSINNGQASYSLSLFENRDAIYSEGFYDRESAVKKLRLHGYDFQEEDLHVYR